MSGATQEGYALDSLSELTACRCNEAYKGRGLRDPDCNCDYRTDVDLVRSVVIAATQNEADAIAAYGDLMIKYAALERENERLRMEAETNITVGNGHTYTPWGYAK